MNSFPINKDMDPTLMGNTNTSNVPLFQQQQQQAQPQQYANSPVIMPNTLPILLDESKNLKRFNVNASRSNSSSSTASSVMSNGNSVMMNSSSFNTNDLAGDMNLYDIKQKCELGKLFEDDVFYCPRSLLSKEELQTCEMLDKFLVHKMMMDSQPLLQQQDPYLNQRQHLTNSVPKFNPYTSKSFNPSP
ncbi:uncharacterized protein KNAG_0F01720 [Huiozyma naganishii CBS 8797]|uniref:Uncharacterized protein n=1 Tax=Huiozyma naganishii (strain ATCC MYA-139 / BCRC 22969 / CBS 8797 / KCTC 17520 / NBRC 10181 / NCYC 3082 / Yp74L-3) TaxID=1071383 RepID=J7R7J2_HUIN7|nr:hypothetical protein KNAG_0F01720 [Kazachstania naganishii CBS 8797]CCK70840.1 hypothetical protein KNAG_0F01720 [Kazachstania naganishii CBS 8797]